MYWLPEPNERVLYKGLVDVSLARASKRAFSICESTLSVSSSTLFLGESLLGDKIASERREKLLAN